MRSVADALRARTIAQVLRMPPADRIALALALGEDDLATFMRATGLDRHAALARLRGHRRLGRTPSACAANGPA